MTMLSLSRRLGITPRSDHEYDPAAAGWLDSGRPEGAPQGAARPALVPQQWAGTNAVRDRDQGHFRAEERAAAERPAPVRSAPAHPAAGQVPAARGPHPLGGEPGADAGLASQPPTARSEGAWPEICDQFGSHLLVLAEQLRAAINVLEAGEDDQERLKRLYQVDHAVTRMRMASRQLRTLAGRDEEPLPGFTTSLLDVIRMAASAIEWYPQVSIGPVAELAIPGYAADDVATLVSALLDNATRYSSGMAMVSCHLVEGGAVMFRIEDTGAGIGREQAIRLNFALNGPVPPVDESAGRHMGFPVVHRIARRHSISVRFTSRPQPDSGTIAMVTVPPQLVCAIPVHDARRTAPAEPPRPEGIIPEVVYPDPAALRPLAPEPATPETVVLPVMPMPEMAGYAPAAEMAAPEMAAPELAVPAMAAPETTPPETAAPYVATPDAQALAIAEPPSVPLPRREPVALRVRPPKPAELAVPSASQPRPQQAASRYAFADDLSAFSEGIREALAARGITDGLVSAMFDGPTTQEGA